MERKILIFTELEQLALDSSNKRLVLFGESRFYDDGKISYDMIFHAKTVPNVYDVHKPVSMVVPVVNEIDLTAASSEDTARYLADLNHKHPKFNNFVVPMKDFLKFYQVHPHKIGEKLLRVVSSHKGSAYRTISERDFVDNINHPELIADIMRTREKIDCSY